METRSHTIGFLCMSSVNAWCPRPRAVLPPGLFRRSLSYLPSSALGSFWLVTTTALRRILGRGLNGPCPLLFLRQVPGQPTARLGRDLPPGLRTRLQICSEPPSRAPSPQLPRPPKRPHLH